MYLCIFDQENSSQLLFQSQNSVLFIWVKPFDIAKRISIRINFRIVPFLFQRFGEKEKY